MAGKLFDVNKDSLVNIKDFIDLAGPDFRKPAARLVGFAVIATPTTTDDEAVKVLAEVTAVMAEAITDAEAGNEPDAEVYINESLEVLSAVASRLNAESPGYAFVMASIVGIRGAAAVLLQDLKDKKISGAGVVNAFTALAMPLVSQFLLK